MGNNQITTTQPEPTPISSNIDTNKCIYKTFSVSLKRKFKLPNDEFMIESYFCALVSSILVHGMLYISKNYIIFYSYFNDDSFLGETKIKIPFTSLIHFKKTSGFLGFKDTIYLETKNKSFTFTWIFSREECFTHISNNWIIHDNAKKENEQAKTKQEINFVDSISDQEQTPSTQEASLESNGTPEKKDESLCLSPVNVENYDLKLIQRRQLAMEMLPSLDIYNFTPYTYTIRDTNLQQFYQIIFTEIPLELNGKTYANWWDLFAERTGVKEMPKFSAWNPRIDVDFTDIINISNLPCEHLSRTINATKTLKGSGPFTPKFIKYYEKQQLHIIDDKQFIIISDVIFLTKFPFSDQFKYPNCWIIKQTAQNEITVEYRFAIDFYKPSFFKGLVERSTLEEQKEVGKLLVILIDELKANGYLILNNTEMSKV